MKYLPLLFCLLPHLLPAQEWVKVFPGDLEERSTSLHALPDGGYMYAMVQNVTENNTNLSSQSVLIRANAQGATIWSRSAAAKNDNFVSTVLTSGVTMCVGSEYVEKRSNRFVALQSVSGKGQVVGKAYFPNPEDDVVFGQSSLSDGGMVFFGANRFTSPGSPTLFLTKVNKKGKVVWHRAEMLKMRYPFITHSDISEDPKGNILLGLTHFSNDAPSIAEFAKFDKNGTLLRSEIVGVPDSKIMAVQGLPDGSYLLAGEIEKKAFVAKYGEDGTQLWLNKLGYGLDVEGMAVNAKGEIAVLSHFRPILVVCNNLGEVLTSKKIELGTGTRCNQVVATNDDGFLVAGSTKLTGQNDTDVFLMKFGPSDLHKDTQNAPDGAPTPGTQKPSSEKEIFQPPSVHEPNLTVTAFPNPVREQLTLRVENEAKITDGEVTVTSVSGKITHQMRFTNAQIELSFAGLPAGTYFYTIHQSGKKVASGKVVKAE